MVCVYMSTATKPWSKDCKCDQAHQEKVTATKKPVVKRPLKLRLRPKPVVKKPIKKTAAATKKACG
jgi:hypothetical protein